MELNNDEVRLLCANLTAMLTAYERHRPGTDANDVISALAWMLCETACLNKVPRDVFMQHLMTVFDTTTLCRHEQRDD